MKKLSFILIVALILSSFCTVPYASAADSMADDMANTLLQDLGIASNFDNLSDGITRAEFCSLVISAINMGELSDSHTLPFTDVTDAHPFYNAVYDAYALGLISSSELFNPDRIITLNEACKIAMSE
ncbi:MAG: S-layer homology domain-containing protein [Ruminococcaceae bacterium]|nr:S-layer homology domain-containing protein [Oscillospiraceae bacterium]